MTSQQASIEHLLLNAGVDKEYVSKDGSRAFFWAVEHFSLQVVQLLVEHGIDVNKRKRTNAGEFALLIASRAGHLALVKLLLRCGADPNHESNHYETSLVAAAEAGHIEVVKALVESGARVDFGGSDGYCVTALMASIEHSHNDIARFLIEKGANPNCATNRFDSTALMDAAGIDNFEGAKMLLQHGADPEMELQGDYIRAIDIVLKANSSSKIVYLILAAGGGMPNAVGPPPPIVSEFDQPHKLAPIIEMQIELTGGTAALWSRFTQVAMIISPLVGNVYQVLWILEFVLAFEAIDVCKFDTTAYCRQELLDVFKRVVCDALDELKRVDFIQNRFDVFSAKMPEKVV